MDEESPDVELLQKWRAGDKRSGNVLLSRHFAGIFRFFEAALHGPEVEDLTQRTFEACITSRDRIRDDAAFRPWLYGIARKQLLKHFERKRPRGQEIPPSKAGLRDPGTSPSGALKKLDQQHVFLQALAMIPEEFRDVLDLFFWQDRSVAEIAEQLGIAVGTVKSRLHRGKARLREAIAQMRYDRVLLDETLASLDERAVEPDA